MEMAYTNTSTRTGRLPAGYRLAWSAAQGNYVELDPVLAPLVAEAFELAATGRWSLTQIAQHLARKGWTGADGRPLAIATMHGMLHNLTYLSGIGDAPTLVSVQVYYRADGAMAARAKSGPVLSTYLSTPDDEV
jgi:hypothetical protein